MRRRVCRKVGTTKPSLVKMFRVSTQKSTWYVYVAAEKAQTEPVQTSLFAAGTHTNMDESPYQHLGLQPYWAGCACISKEQESLSRKCHTHIPQHQEEDTATLQQERSFFLSLYTAWRPLSSIIGRCTLYTPGCRMKAYK